MTKLGGELEQVNTLVAAHGEQAVLDALRRAVAFRRWRAADIGSILAAGNGVPSPRGAGAALILDLPVAPTRSLDAYRDAPAQACLDASPGPRASIWPSSDRHLLNAAPDCQSSAIVLTRKTWGGLMGFILGALVGIVLFVASHPRGSPVEVSLRGAVWGIVGGILGAAIGWGIRKSIESERKEQARQEREAREKLSRIQEQERLRRDASAAAVRAATNGVSAYRRLPEALLAARGEIDSAKRFWDDGAYSPFWSAIEGGYRAVSTYRKSVEQIQLAAAEHAGSVANLINAGGDPTTMALFPVQLDQKAVSQAVRGPLDALHAQTYEAQKQPVFAQIWEQRRTTTAVIDGFANLEQAVNSMGAAVQSAIHRMSDGLSASNERIASALANLPRTPQAEVDPDQTRQMQHLVAAARDIKMEVHRIGHGHYPMW